MGNNPLQQYFRQPKIFLRLPSLGVYNDQTSIQGNVESLPIFGMTGMDQIISKTPDALISGESTVKVIESCCPSIKNAWDITSIDIDCVLVAVRIATFGDKYQVTHKCSSCDEINEYEIDLSSYIDHFNNCVYDSKIVYDDLIIRIKPLTYKQATELNLENFALQKQLSKLDSIEDSEQKKQLLSKLFNELGELQNKILLASIESVETPVGIVEEWAYIKEWLENSDKSISDLLKDKLDKNSNSWKVAPSDIKCTNCGNEEKVSIELDQSNFFAEA